MLYFGLFSILTAFVAIFLFAIHKLSCVTVKSPQNANFGDFVFFLPYLDEDCRETDLKYLNEAEKPDYLFGRPTLADFNMITFGAYSELCDAVGEKDKDEILAMRDIVKAIYPNKTDKDIDAEPALSIFGFASFACKEVDRINKLFSQVHLEYSSQEVRAGIEDLQFGVFGILDWYAKRMGITDQNLVFNERWVRIYQCMKNDTEEAAFNRRLQKVYESDAKRGH